MELIYMTFLPLVFLVGLMVYIYTRNPREWANRIFALYTLDLAISSCAVLVQGTTTSLALAQAAATTLVVTVGCLHVFFLLALVLALYYPRHLTRWYGMPLLLGLSLFSAAAVVVDAALGLRWLLVLPTQTGYVPVNLYVNGSWVAFLWVWLASGYFSSLLLLGIAAARQGRREIAPIVWLMGTLLACGAINGLLAVYPLALALSPLLFAVALSFVIARYRLFPSTEVAMGAVFHSATEGMVICSQEQTVEQINVAAGQMAGVAAREAIGRPITEAFAAFLQRARPEPGMPSLCEAVARGIDQPLETLLRLDEPEQRWLAAIAMPIMDDRGRHLGCLLTLSDVTDRERARQTQEAQSRLVETIRELSTPIIPVTTGVLILPLIGAIDSARARNVMDAMLQAIHQQRARVILIDITGVPLVDTMVASYLVQSVQAARLLGCQGVLVGIRAEVARTLVELGMSLEELETKATLQDGLEYAIAQVKSQPGGAVPAPK